MKRIFQCKICGKEIAALGFGYHVSRLHNMSSKEYYDKYLKQPGEGLCKVCGKPTKHYRVGRYLKYCSNACSNADGEVIEKKSKTLQKNYGVDFVLQIHGMQSKIEKYKLKYDGIVFDSSYEVQYYIYCKDHNIKCIFHPEGLWYEDENGKRHKYFPDFLINDNEYIEIKSSWFLDNKERNNNTDKSKYNFMVNVATILTEKELVNVFEYINKKYDLHGRKNFRSELLKGNIK